MDAQAIYARSLRDQFMRLSRAVISWPMAAMRYSDSAYTMSQWSTSLEPGVDCPDRATYVSAANWMGSNYMAEEPDPRTPWKHVTNQTFAVGFCFCCHKLDLHIIPSTAY